MIIPTFVNLQGFIIGKKFVEKAMLRKGAILSYYIFTSHAMKFLDKVLRLLNAYHHGMGKHDDSVQHGETPD